MHVTYSLWVILNDAKKCGALSDGRNHNYHITMDREHAHEIYQELKKEFG